jgi:hypothetical protein
MRNCVLCLPLTLPSEVRLGLVLTPFVVSMVSKLTGLASVCCLNLTGMRYKGLKNADISWRSEQFRRLMERLDMPMERYWADSEKNHVARLQDYCDSLVVSGQLQSQVTSRLICKCGAVEIIDGAVNPVLLKNHKVIQQRGNQLFCKLCNTTFDTVHGPSLLLESRFAGGVIKVYPAFYHKEIETLEDDYNQPLLVSRQVKGDVNVLLFGRKWKLDTDFCWSFLFSSLIEEGFRPAVVVVSNRSLKPLVWSLGTSRKLTNLLQGISVIVTPYMQPQGESDSARWIVKELIDRYGSPTVRLLLGSALKWGQKEVTLNSSAIFWGLKALARDSVAISCTSKVHSVPEALELMEGSYVDQLIANLRKTNTVQLSPYGNLLLGKASL